MNKSKFSHFLAVSPAMRFSGYCSVEKCQNRIAKHPEGLERERL